MTDTSSDPNDANPTTPFDPPEPVAPVVPPLAAPPPPPIAPPPPVAAPPPAVPPTWRSSGNDPGRASTIVFGVILLAIGLWFFADQTLGLDMPRLSWSQLWPILLIGFGAWIAIGSMRRR
jgi:Domain of unknown function (DUF5668)